MTLVRQIMAWSPALMLPPVAMFLVAITMQGSTHPLVLWCVRWWYLLFGACAFVFLATWALLGVFVVVGMLLGRFGRRA